MDIGSFREQYDHYGFCVVPDVFSPAEVEEMRSVNDTVIDRARGLTVSDDVFDLERSHRPDAPRVRRVKRPHDAHPFFRELAADTRSCSPMSRP